MFQQDNLEIQITPVAGYVDVARVLKRASEKVRL